MKKITLAHGGGGKLTNELIRKIIVKHLGNPELNKLDDSAVLKEEKGDIAFTTDSYVVDPIFFPGGDIGKLAVCGTINDLSVCGAKPLYISLSLIIEEGFSVKDLEKIAKSIKKEAKANSVKVVCGDTKVVNKGKADKIFINTSGIGKVIAKKMISSSLAKPGDKIIVSGSIGDHSTAVLSSREELKLHTNLKSDCASLAKLTQKMIKASDNIHVMRDPTRGGIATILNEVAEASKVGITIHENVVPIKKQTKAACEILGFDPLYLASEGRLVAFVKSSDSKKIIKAMRSNSIAKEASVIGEVTAEHKGKVLMETLSGGKRIVDTFSGEQLPRIC